MDLDILVRGDNETPQFSFSMLSIGLSLLANGTKYELQLSNQIEIDFSTFLGGTELDQVLDIATDIEGNTYVVGHTESVDFPILNAYDDIFNGGDAFLTSFFPNGTLRWSTS